jgi:hypothetical protein
MMDKEIEELLENALKAICLTVDYILPYIELPAIEGWEWYDAGKAIALKIPDSEWSKQFWVRVGEEHKEDENKCLGKMENTL